MKLIRPAGSVLAFCSVLGLTVLSCKAQLSMDDDSSSTDAQATPAAVGQPPAGGTGSGIDYGDAQSSSLTTKAWDAFNGKKYEIAKAYAEKCINLYQADALKMQADLSGKPTKDQATTLWALNDVGTCYLIMGKVLNEQGDKDGTKQVLKYLINNLKYSEAWDPKGWFWFPADAARTLLSTVH